MKVMVTKPENGEATYTAATTMSPDAVLVLFASFLMYHVRLTQQIHFLEVLQLIGKRCKFREWCKCAKYFKAA